MVVAAFVAPYLLEATARFVLSAARLPGVELAVITTSPDEALSPELKQALAGHWQVADALDPQQIADAVRGLSGQLGPVQRLIGALEQLQVPLAQARDVLGIEGMSEQVAHNVRDKSQMKSLLAAAGVPCARHQLIHRTEQAVAFRDLVGYPMVAKPPDGAGAKATFRLDSDADFDSWLVAAQHDPREVWLLEGSWSVASTPSTPSPSAGRHTGLRSRTTSRRRWRCCAPRGCSGRCCCRVMSRVRSTPASAPPDPPP